MISSTRSSDEEIKSIMGLQYPFRNSLEYYAGSAGIEDPNTNTDTLPNTDSSSNEESIPTRPSTPGPILTSLSLTKESMFLGFEPSGKNMNEPKNYDPLLQPTTPFLSTTGDIDSQANLSPSGGMTPISCQLYGTLARSTNEPGSEEWSQEPNSPYRLLLEGLDLLGLPLQLTQIEVNKKYQRRFKERYLNSIRELAWWRTPMGKLCKEADGAGEREEVEAIRRLMTSQLLAGAGGGEASSAQNPDEGDLTGPDKGKASKHRPLMVEDLRRFGLLKPKDEPKKTLSKRDDLWSLLKPPDWRLPPDPLPQPTGQGSEDAKHWQGTHENLERFLMDCLMYFKTFSGYFVYDAQKVVFAASHLDGNVKEWWSQRSQEYLSQEGPAY
ncbi:hypothetical protein IW262DRAFT_1298601 [Armillaria fumosa]|nr:hypothetical protein IW262DRAFT_1298601 [Armillaria fumosa]